MLHTHKALHKHTKNRRSFLAFSFLLCPCPHVLFSSQIVVQIRVYSHGGRGGKRYERDTQKVILYSYRHPSATLLAQDDKSSNDSLFGIPIKPHASTQSIYEVKLLVKLTTTSFNLCSRSLLKAPSLSIVSKRSVSLLLRCARKSASHCVILRTGT